MYLKLTLKMGQIKCSEVMSFVAMQRENEQSEKQNSK